jgi:hypothetical protein
MNKSDKLSLGVVMQENDHSVSSENWQADIDRFLDSELASAGSSQSTDGGDCDFFDDVEHQSPLLNASTCQALGLTVEERMALPGADSVREGNMSRLPSAVSIDGCGTTREAATCDSTIAQPLSSASIPTEDEDDGGSLFGGAEGHVDCFELWDDCELIDSSYRPIQDPANVGGTVCSVAEPSSPSSTLLTGPPNFRNRWIPKDESPHQLVFKLLKDMFLDISPPPAKVVDLRLDQIGRLTKRFCTDLKRLWTSYKKQKRGSSTENNPDKSFDHAVELYKKTHHQ